MATYLEQMDRRIRQMREKDNLVGIRFCANGEASPEHRERMAEAFCFLMDLEKDGFLEKASCNIL